MGERLRRFTESRGRAARQSETIESLVTKLAALVPHTEGDGTARVTARAVVLYALSSGGFSSEKLKRLRVLLDNSDEEMHPVVTKMYEATAGLRISGVMLRATTQFPTRSGWVTKEAMFASAYKAASVMVGMADKDFEDVSWEPQLRYVVNYYSPLADVRVTNIAWLLTGMPSDGVKSAFRVLRALGNAIIMDEGPYDADVRDTPRLTRSSVDMWSSGRESLVRATRPALPTVLDAVSAREWVAKLRAAASGRPSGRGDGWTVRAGAGQAAGDAGYRGGYGSGTLVETPETAAAAATALDGDPAAKLAATLATMIPRKGEG